MNYNITLVEKYNNCLKYNLEVRMENEELSKFKEESSKNQLAEIALVMEFAHLCIKDFAEKEKLGNNYIANFINGYKKVENGFDAEIAILVPPSAALKKATLDVLSKLTDNNIPDYVLRVIETEDGLLTVSNFVNVLVNILREKGITSNNNMNEAVQQQ
jgi:hypothetical protein